MASDQYPVSSSMPDKGMSDMAFNMSAKGLTPEMAYNMSGDSLDGFMDMHRPQSELHGHRQDFGESIY